MLNKKPLVFSKGLLHLYLCVLCQTNVKALARVVLTMPVITVGCHVVYVVVRIIEGLLCYCVTNVLNILMLACFVNKFKTWFY